MKTAVTIAVVIIGALYLYNNRSSPLAGQVVKHEAATLRLQTRTVTAAPTQNVGFQTAQNAQPSRELVALGTSAPRSTSIVVAPMPKVGLKTGPNAQTNLSSTTDRWKTGPNAQINLSSTTDRWKTGPNAQTDLTMKRSW